MLRVRRVPGLSVAAVVLTLTLGACAGEPPPVAMRSAAQGAAGSGSAEQAPASPTALAVAAATTPESTQAAPAAQAAESAAPPTASPIPPTPTATRAAGAPASPPKPPTATPATPTRPTAPTSAPAPTAAPTTAAPAPTAAPAVVAPAPTAAPAQPTSTASPTPTDQTGSVISCSVSPRGQVRVGETIQLTASTNRADLIPISFVFDHGDGTTSTGPVSTVQFQYAGYYRVTLLWSDALSSGRVDCGQVIVGPLFNAADYVGKPRAVAEQVAAQNGYTVRIGRVDGESYPGTADHRLDRLNLEIDAGIVTNAFPG